MEFGEKYLPIGTIVLLKGGKKELMIVSYCIVPNGDVYDKNGKVDGVQSTMFDYGGCVYPEGMLSSDQIYAFNHDQIDKVCYMGYKTEQQEKVSQLLIAGVEARDKRLAEENEKKQDN